MKRVTIVGGRATPFRPLPGEVWGLNAIRPSWTTRFAWTRWFNLHRYRHMRRDWTEGLHRELLWASDHPHVPFYTLDDAWPKWTTTMLVKRRVFPRAALRARFGTEYHAGSFDWLVAYAIYEGFEEIRLHGVGLNLESGEPISARACLEYWCGRAEGLGIRVVCRDCDLFTQYHLVKSHTVYGYDDVKLIEER